MIKLTAEQLSKASELAEHIEHCERVKDNPEGHGIHGYSSFLPLSRQVVINAANDEIARCHEAMKAMGIELAPENVKPQAPSLGSRIPFYVSPMGAAFGAAIGRQVDRYPMPASKLYRVSSKDGPQGIEGEMCSVGNVFVDRGPVDPLIVGQSGPRGHSRGCC